MSPQYTVNFGPLAAEIGLPVWGTPADFNGFLDLAALLHGSQVVSARLGPDHIVLDGDPAPLSHRGTVPIFGPYLLWPNGWMD